MMDITEKRRILQDCLFRWIRLGQAGITIETLMIKRGYDKVAIYGYDRIAECLLYELKNSRICVEAIIDRKAEQVLIDFPVYTLDLLSNLEIDAIIVCPVDDYQTIRKEILDRCGVSVLTFEELIYEL